MSWAKMNIKNFLNDLRRLANVKFNGNQEKALTFLINKSKYFSNIIKDLIRFSNGCCSGCIKGALKYLNKKLR